MPVPSSEDAMEALTHELYHTSITNKRAHGAKKKFRQEKNHSVRVTRKSGRSLGHSYSRLRGVTRNNVAPGLGMEKQSATNAGHNKLGRDSDVNMDDVRWAPSQPGFLVVKDFAALDYVDLTAFEDGEDMDVFLTNNIVIGEMNRERNL